MNKNKFDKRLLVNIAKGTTAWAGMTFLLATPMLMDAKDPIASYFLGCAATGVIFPLTLWAGTKYKDKNFVGQWYVNLFDKVFTKKR